MGLYLFPQQPSIQRCPSPGTKRWVGSGDEFIDRIASGSSVSGERYQVECQGSRLYSENWLRGALKDFPGSSERE